MKKLKLVLILLAFLAPLALQATVLELPISISAYELGDSGTVAAGKVLNLDDFIAWASKNGLAGISRENLQSILDLVDSNGELAKRIALAVKEVKPSETLTDLAQQLNLKFNAVENSLSIYEARVWYSWRKAKISDTIVKTQPLEMQAREALNMRNDIRTGTRKAMKDLELAKFLDSKEKNLSWEDAILKYGNNDEGYQAIIEASMRGRPSVDSVLQIPKVK